MPLEVEARNITTMRLPAKLLRDLTEIAIRRGMSRTKLVEREMIALVKRERDNGDDEDPFA
jgi:metal-responsive CopG/Arc/MetJ family transcriptional regulator